MNADMVAPFVEDDLDEADFYAGQGMFSEAMGSLRALAERHPDHPLILAKMRDVAALEHGDGISPPTGQGEASETVDASLVALDSTGATGMLDLDEIEEVSEEELADVDVDIESDSGSAPPVKRKPTVMLENPVDEGDAETHYDLGLAYKEMGLFRRGDQGVREDAARPPNREVQVSRDDRDVPAPEQGNPAGSDPSVQARSATRARPHRGAPNTCTTRSARPTSRSATAARRCTTSKPSPSAIPRSPMPVRAPRRCGRASATRRRRCPTTISSPTSRPSRSRRPGSCTSSNPSTDRDRCGDRCRRTCRRRHARRCTACASRDPTAR